LPKSNFTATAQRLPISTRISPGLKPPTCDIEIQSFYCRNDAIFPHHDLPFLAAIDIATGNQHLRYQNHRFGVAVVHFGGSSGVVAKPGTARICSSPCAARTSMPTTLPGWVQGWLWPARWR
jgi:hypothetical protein